MVLVEVFIGNKAILVNFSIHFKISHFKVARPHLGIDVLWSVEDFTKVGQRFFNISSQVVSFFDFCLANGKSEVRELTQAFEDFFICFDQSIIKEGKFNARPSFEIHPRLGNFRKSFIAKVSRLWHKAVVTNVAELNLNLFKDRKGSFEVFKSVELALVVTDKFIDFFTCFFNGTQEVFLVLVEGCEVPEFVLRKFRTFF